MTKLFTKEFWEVALERMVRSAAQGFLAAAGVVVPAMSPPLDADYVLLSWDGLQAGLYGAGSMALLSVITTLAFTPQE